MRITSIASSLALILLVTALAIAKDSPEQKKQKTRKMAAQTLKDLYKLEPTAKELIQKSAGYAVFNNMGTNLFLLATARGAGVATNTKNEARYVHEDDLGGCRPWAGSERL